ncbi:hypothetical protein Tco_1375086 [Tanacetum coccineum]
MPHRHVADTWHATWRSDPLTRLLTDDQPPLTGGPVVVDLWSGDGLAVVDNRSTVGSEQTGVSTRNDPEAHMVSCDWRIQLAYEVRNSMQSLAIKSVQEITWKMHSIRNYVYAPRSNNMIGQRPE